MDVIFADFLTCCLHFALLEIAVSPLHSKRYNAPGDKIALYPPISAYQPSAYAYKDCMLHVVVLCYIEAQGTFTEKSILKRTGKATGLVVALLQPVFAAAAKIAESAVMSPAKVFEVRL